MANRQQSEEGKKKSVYDFRIFHSKCDVRKDDSH